ncbi:MAG: hypothetical protein IT260_24195 [Saprospiraceae bacterium]|nr:hypothetical protein [Saprospiraceae bacterium]
MSVTIALPPGVEEQLRDTAAQQGLSIEQYITQVVLSGISGSNQPDAEALSEDDLLQRIQLNIQARDLDAYYELVARRKADQLRPEEYETLLALTNRIELAHAERMKYVAALAKWRGVSLEQIILDLGLQSQTR